MKIEIELAEVERLRNQVKDLEVSSRKLETDLKEANPKEMEAKAILLAKMLFHEYIATTFKCLGFQSGYNRDSVSFPDNIERWLGKSWWSKPDSVKMELSVTVTNEFRSAFLSMRIIENKPEEVNLLDLIQ